MPQAIATGAVLVILILACLLISIDLFVYLVVLFMVLALWELRVDFATAGLHIPVAVLWESLSATAREMRLPNVTLALAAIATTTKDTSTHTVMATI